MVGVEALSAAIGGKRVSVATKPKVGIAEVVVDRKVVEMAFGAQVFEKFNGFCVMLGVIVLIGLHQHSGCGSFGGMGF